MSLSELNRLFPEVISATRERSVDLRELLNIMQLSRECDRREDILFKQGKGYFHMPTAGHEGIAVIANHLEPGDYVWPYYRDRALVLAMGTPLSEIARAYFAKPSSSSAGRQLPNHFSDRERNIVSVASPTALQCLPAAGTAWACRQAAEGKVTICCVGEASTRQGEFYEAWCFAVQESLPLVLVVEDNAYGISTPTSSTNPLALGVLSGPITCVNGRDVDALDEVVARAIKTVRAGIGPSLIWASVDRLMSHASSDDQRLYRSFVELDSIRQRDPIHLLRRRLQDDGLLDEDEWNSIATDLAVQVDRCYRSAEQEPDPNERPDESFTFAPDREMSIAVDGLKGSDKTIADAFRSTMHSLLESDERVLMFGQDIEDPKGGVFGITKGLSTSFPGRVRNAPLAEATIAGLAAGLAVAGYKPVFELQFVDFVGTALNQLANQIATMRWRTGGQWKCPAVLYAPCGGYVPASGPWHSQTNEGCFAHIPGLKVSVPSTPEDVGTLFRAAVHGDDPVMILIPKHLFRVTNNRAGEGNLPLGKGRLCRAGADATVVSWGNTVQVAYEASERLNKEGIRADIIDLRTIVPCDWSLIRNSLARTGRLIVVQEDAKTGSFGQAIIGEITTSPSSWDMLTAPPQLVTRRDVPVGFHPAIEAVTLPSAEDVAAAVRLCMNY
jgi:2-oxoisovalerate dehydrogenase E1 component